MADFLKKYREKMKLYTKIFFFLSFFVAFAIIFVKNSASDAQKENKQITKIEKDDTNKAEKNHPKHKKSFESAIDIIKEYYVEEKTDKQIYEDSISSILSSLDPHSSYLNKDTLNEVKVQTEGEFGGVGIEITLEHTLIKVISALEGTPAKRANIQPMDYISHVDGEMISGLSLQEIVKKLRGKPGTKVTITVLRNGENKPLEIDIIREKIKIKSIEEIKNIDDIIYVKVNIFSAQTTNEVENGVKKIIKNNKNIKGLILDLRNNPGGLLSQSVDLSDLFLDKNKTIVSIKGRKQNQIFKSNNIESLIPKLPLVVLINEGSASASEIVAGALQDNKRAIIMGMKSFGKGSVQTIIPIGENALKLTTSLYYTPSGVSIQANGIIPDIMAKRAKIEFEENKNVREESKLNGHLKTQIKKFTKQKNDHKNKKNKEIHQDDYPLTKALDLIEGINLFKKIN